MKIELINAKNLVNLVLYSNEQSGKNANRIKISRGN